MNSLCRKTCQFNKRCFEKARSKFKAVNPYIKKMKIWNIFFMILTYINFFILTLEMCFFIEDSQETMLSSYPIISAIKILNFLGYGFDIALNFFIGYHIGGSLEMDLKKIRKRYFLNLFYQDVIAYVPVFLFFFEDYLFGVTRKFCLINILFFFIMKKYTIKLKDFKEFLIQEQEEYENWFSIALLYLRAFFVSHIFACLWYLVGIYANSKTSWVEVYNGNSLYWGDKYLNALYWSLVTMVTVGYGDIVPQNQYEKTFCIMTVLIGFTLFGYTMANFGDIIRKINAKHENLEY